MAKNYREVAEYFQVEVDQVREWKRRGAPGLRFSPYDLVALRGWLGVDEHVVTADAELPREPSSSLSSGATPAAHPGPDRSVAAPTPLPVHTHDVEIAPSDGPTFSQRILDIGFLSGLFLAGIALIGSIVYLMYFQIQTHNALERLLTYATTASPANSGPERTVTRLPDSTLQLAIASRMIMARMTLLSCGAFIGMAFGFLGFSLFLLGVRGEMDVSARREQYLVKIVRMSPGVFIVTCAAVVITICVTYTLPFDFLAQQGGPVRLAGNTGAGAGAASPDQSDGDLFNDFKESGAAAGNRAAVPGKSSTERSSADRFEQLVPPSPRRVDDVPAKTP